jgi:hypothetical protein
LVSWASKIELAMHTGNVGSPFRKQLGAIAAANPGEVRLEIAVYL